MKFLKIFTTVISITFAIDSPAQVVVPNNLLNKFVGTWRWTSGTDTVEIVLEKQVFIIEMTGSHSEQLVGWHKYVKNGIINQSSYQYIGRNVNLESDSSNVDLKTTLQGTTHANNPNQVYFYSFWDVVLHMNFNIFFTLQPGSTTKANWVLRQPRGLYVGPPGLNGVFTLPKQLVLTKQ